MIVAILAAGFAFPRVVAQTPSFPNCKNDDLEYERVLDGYFAHARGDKSSAVILRVYGGLFPEYEVVLDPEISTHLASRYAPQRSIWAGAYDVLFTGKHKTVADYNVRALKIPTLRKQFKISVEQFETLLNRARLIDISICEHFPLRDSAGHDHTIEDAPWFEIIIDGGRKRARVTDTSDFKEIVSQNGPFLAWGLDINEITRAPIH